MTPRRRSLPPVERALHDFQHVYARARRTRTGRVVGLPAGYAATTLRALTAHHPGPVPWLPDGRTPCDLCSLPTRRLRPHQGQITVNVYGPGIPPGPIGWAPPPPGITPALAVAISEAQAAARLHALHSTELHRRLGR